MINLWDCIYNHLRETEEFEKCTTPRTQKLEELFNDYSNQFQATFTKEQKEAFRGLMSIGDALRFCDQESGFAAGIKIATQLHNLLENPYKFHSSASETYFPIEFGYKVDIAALNAYLATSEAQEKAPTSAATEHEGSYRG